MRAVSTAAMLMLLCCAGTGMAAVDSLYRAGKFLGQYLYWVPKQAVSPDTTEWGCLAGVVTPSERQGIASTDSAASLLSERDWALYRIKECSAMGLALLVEQGYHVCALVQWHASLNRKVIVALPGMPQSEKRHSLISDFHWESVNRARLSGGGGEDGYQVEIYFADHGYSAYEDKELVAGDNAQILGTTGFSLRIPELAFNEDMNVRRKVFALYLVAAAEKTAKDIISEVEKAMDARNLDLSYTVPKIVPVQSSRGKDTQEE
ncbi:MAG: hypothetical protein GF331_12460 [Chitinivibrionales bacterium]|nr:hypothetical protein [Chitinivibrionales bacterium]